MTRPLSSEWTSDLCPEFRRDKTPQAMESQCKAKQSGLEILTNIASLPLLEIQQLPRKANEKLGNFGWRKGNSQQSLSSFTMMTAPMSRVETWYFPRCPCHGKKNEWYESWLMTTMTVMILRTRHPMKSPKHTQISALRLSRSRQRPRKSVAWHAPFGECCNFRLGKVLSQEVRRSSLPTTHSKRLPFKNPELYPQACIAMPLGVKACRSHNSQKCGRL